MLLSWSHPVFDFKADILPYLLLQSSCALDTVSCNSNSNLTFLSNQLFLWTSFFWLVTGARNLGLTETSLFTIQPYPVGCQVLTDPSFKTSPLLRTLCSCYFPSLSHLFDTASYSFLGAPSSSHTPLLSGLHAITKNAILVHIHLEKS